MASRAFYSSINKGDKADLSFWQFPLEISLNPLRVSCRAPLRWLTEPCKREQTAPKSLCVRSGLRTFRITLGQIPKSIRSLYKWARAHCPPWRTRKWPLELPKRPHSEDIGKPKFYTQPRGLPPSPLHSPLKMMHNDRSHAHISWHWISCQLVRFLLFFPNFAARYLRCIWPHSPHTPPGGCTRLAAFPTQNKTLNIYITINKIF